VVWIERYRPRSLEEIVGQDPIVARLTSWAESGNVPHLLLSGPHGTGKSTAVECLARGLYGEQWEVNTSLLRTAELFELGKPYLEAEERFAHIYRKDESLIANVKYVIKWYASLQPLDAPFKLLVFEEASALTQDAQQALRRIMEQFSRTCRFVFCTTNPSALIPAITSRCFPLSFSRIPEEVILERLQYIAVEEGLFFPSDDLTLVAKAADGDLRRGIMHLQVLSEAKGRPDLESISLSETATLAATTLRFLRERDLISAQKTVESLMIDYGLTGREVIRELSRTIQREYNDPRLTLQIAEADLALLECGSEFLQLNALLTRMLQEVFCAQSPAAL
jgi:replication factor C small subunit